MNPQDDPTKRYLYAGYEITEKEINEIFKKNPLVEVIILPDGRIIKKP